MSRPSGGFATPSTIAPLLSSLLLVLSAAGAATAESGVGLCVLGEGASLYTSAGATFVGVNVGWDNSTTSAHTARAAYEAECCAETHQPPDCFRPAA